eukprot:3594125-Lingulodinium_polyedra.AAC.1
MHAMPTHATQCYKAVASTFSQRNGSQTARSRTPRAHQLSGARMESARVPFTSRCDGARSTRSHHCA